MEESLIKLDIFNMGHDAFKAIKFKSKNNEYFVKRYIRKIKINQEIIHNQPIKNELRMKDIKHPNLIEILDSITVKNYIYILYKYYDFPDLIVIYNSNILNAKDIYFFNIDIIIQLLDVVNFLHSKNIVHRDIKIENILYDEMRCKIYLCDYEYCINYYEGGDNTHITPAGTDKYLAPEITAYNKTINHRKVDIWNLGIVFFIILSKGNLLTVSEFLQPHIVKKHLLENEYQFISNCFASNPSSRLEAHELLELEYLK
jgi:serine/threonine protein kinase